MKKYKAQKFTTGNNLRNYSFYPLFFHEEAKGLEDHQITPPEK